MELNAIKFGVACGITASVVWTICSLLVIAIPTTMMMQIAGYMTHMNLVDLQHSWALSAQGYFLGLIAWVLTSGLTGWLVAVLYNKLSGD